METVDRFRGSFIGLAVGDALGHPTEFISSVPRIRAKYGEQGLTDFQASGVHKPGTFTDDTQMSIAVARALVRAGNTVRAGGGLALDALMTLLGREFVAWAEHPTNNRAPGGTCLAGCRKLKGGASWRDAGVKESKGCGAAMRAAPVGLFFYDDDEALVRVAAAQSVLTHSHPTGIASSVAAAAPVAWVLKGNGLDGIIEYTKEMVSRVTPEILRDLGAKDSDIDAIGIREQMEMLDETAAALGDDSEDVCQFLGGAWVGEEAVACALWCVLKAKGDFTESVLRGANSSGDSDSIACIAGSIAGALGGVAGIKPEWVSGVERSEDLDALARKLWDVKSSKADEPSLPGKLDFFDVDKPRAPSTSVTKLDSTEEYTPDADDTPAADAPEGDDDEDPVAAERLPDLDGLGTADLEALVERHNRLYWELAAPVISDVEFDRLCRALSARDPSSRALKHLGARPDAFSAVKHREPMLSLDKCYEQSDLEKWAGDLGCDDVLAMPKIDGLACSLRYDASGNLEVAATRGDGEEGEDITPNARGVADIPARIDPERAPLEVRGEVFMSLRVFEKHKARSAGERGANPRNLAAGALRQKDPNATRRMELSFLAYDVRGDGAGAFTRQRDKLALAKDAGFRAIDVVVVPVNKAMDAVAELSARRGELGYETDGVVLMADDVAAHKRLGATAHHPRWALAWKFQGEEGTSVLRGVEWSVARTGTITPVALVEPVQLSGVTVGRATLHHKGFLAKLGLSIGASIAMVRRGGVIPHVERVLSPGTEPVPVPSTCPACGAPVVEEGDFLLCSKPESCVAARVGRLLHFAEAADIQGLGEVVVEEAVQKGLLTTPADLYGLSAGQLAALEKCGDKNAQKIVAEIDRARRLPLDVLLRALGIASLGKTAARTLAERYETLARVRAVTAGELSAIKGFGEVIAAAIVEGLRENAALLDALEALLELGAAPSSTTGGLAGKSFVFTGKLRIDRKAAEARVKALGAAVPSGVTKALTYLVIGASDRASPSTKQKAAEKLVADGAALQIIDEDAFEALMSSLSSASTSASASASTSASASATPAPAATTTPASAAPVTPSATAAASPAPAATPPPTTPAVSSAQPTDEAGGAEPVMSDPKKRQLTLF